MDSCSDDILTRIGNFLPWKDRLRFERLSSRFENLLYQPVQNERFELDIETYGNSFLFTVSTEKKDEVDLHVVYDKEREQVEAILDKYFLRLAMGEDEFRGCKPIDIYLASATECFDFAISALRRLMSIFSFANYTMNITIPGVLEVLTELLNAKRHRSQIPEKLSIVYSIYLGSNGAGDLDEEEWDFLEGLQGIYSFTFNGEVEWEPMALDRLTKLPLFDSVKELELTLGKIFSDKNWLSIPIEYDFLQQLVDQKTEVFECDCMLTPKDILRYLKNCLAGSHALKRLHVELFDPISESDLLSMGFEVENYDENEILKATKVLNWQKEEGREPDRILVKHTSRSDTVIIEADYDEYRNNSENV